MQPPERHDQVWTRRRFLKAAGTVVVGTLSIGLIAYELDELLAPPSPGSPIAVTPSSSAQSPFLIAAASPFASPSPSSLAGELGATPPAATAAATANPLDGRQIFRSRPDLTPPIVVVQTPAGAVAAGYLFLTPNNGAGTDGPMIADNLGQLVWSRPDTGTAAANFRVQQYHGAPVLTWWEGTVNGGNGVGEYVIADSSYREIARVKAGHGVNGDLHEFLITARNTALITGGSGLPAGQRIGLRTLPWPVYDDVVQEIDIATGSVLFEWHSVSAIDPAESFVPPPTGPTDLYDYVHANSAEVDTDGNLLVSARNTSAIYKINRLNGAVMWRLGGKKSNFTMGPQTSFGWQHDVRRRPDGTLSLYDDNLKPTPSRGLVLRIDETAMTATFVRSYLHPDPLYSASQGNLQLLSNGNAFVGWGSVPWLTEYAPDGRVVFDATFPAGVQSYRNFRFPWTGRPTDSPRLAISRAADETVLAAASWNGATEVAAWEIVGGASRTSDDLVKVAPRTGFETSIPIPSAPAWLALHARDVQGNLLGSSEPVATA